MAMMHDLQARARLRRRVSELGLNAVARASGVNAGQLSRWLRNQCDMSWVKVLRVVDAAGLRIQIEPKIGRPKKRV